MNNQESIKCIVPEELSDYFGSLLPEAREDVIEEHLAECLPCTERARQMRLLNYLLAQRAPSAAEAGALRAAVAATLQQAPERTELTQWRARLGRWRENWAGQAAAAWRVMLGEDAQLVSAELADLLFAGAQSAAVPTPRRTRGAVRTRGSAPARSNKPQPRLTATVAAGAINVCLSNWPPSQPAPLVLLIATQEPGVLQVREPQWQEDLQSWLARFEQVEPGEYLLVLEPPSHADA